MTQFFLQKKDYNRTMQIVEAVPNISEGRRPEVIQRIANATQNIPGGARILHIDANPDANRTVMTLAGTPQAVEKSLFMLIQTTTQEIDMRIQRGAHPRLGAVDVCPIVPIRGITLSDTARLAEQFARRVANQLHLPTYLYEANALTPQRKNLAFIRRGEYENLASKLHTLPPDFGPTQYDEHIAKTGAIVIGARNFLIAFNMSLDTQDISIAREIATRLRQSSGGLPYVKAIGWYMDHYHCAQVSCNLTDYAQTGLAQVWETCRQEATALNTHITAGELIGLIPLDALTQVGQFYKPEEKNSATLVDVAVENLLLNKIRPFMPEERILEYKLKQLL